MRYEKAKLTTSDVGKNNECSLEATVAPDGDSGVLSAAIPIASMAADTTVKLASDAVSFATEKIEDTAALAVAGLEDGASYIGQKTEEVLTAAEGGLRSLGLLPEEGEAAEGTVSPAMVAVIEASKGEATKDDGADVTKLIGRNAVPAMLVGLASGVLFARPETP
tara:strand:+ start:159 stop:653 length:495 start_codon:yes stop_codon:yes gene_type:complete